MADSNMSGLRVLQNGKPTEDGGPVPYDENTIHKVSLEMTSMLQRKRF